MICLNIQGASSIEHTIYGHVLKHKGGAPSAPWLDPPLTMILKSILTIHLGTKNFGRLALLKMIIILGIIPASPQCYGEADPLSVTLRSSVRLRYGAMVWISVMKVEVC